MKKISAAKQNASIESISILGLATERMSPMALHWYAKVFYEAAISLPKTEYIFNPDLAYLVSHSIELSLKAFLSIKNISMLDLASIRHNLIALIETSEKNDLASFVTLSNDQLSVVALANEYYQGKVFEYPAIGEMLKGYEKMPNLEILFSVAESLVEALQQPCLNTK